MKNRDVKAAWAYHDGTKHSYEKIRTDPHYLDWENQPIPFKIYPELPPIPLPQHLSSSGMPALEALTGPFNGTAGEVVPSIQAVSELLFLSAGVTKRRTHPGGEMLFRAAACTGALYHIDLYLVGGELPGLQAGVYHFSPHDFALRKLRAGDYRQYLIRSSGNEPSIADAPCVIVSASTFWRNAWKYQSRAYRHCYWDNGTILANLAASAAARRVPAKIVAGFVDGMVAELLALDQTREAPLSLTALGYSRSAAAGASPRLDPLTLATVPLSRHEIDYPAIRAMHEASSLDSEEEVAAWRQRAKEEIGKRKAETGEKGRVFPLKPLSDEEMPQDTIEEVIIRRGSTREFSRQPIALSHLSTALERCIRGVPADFLPDLDASFIDVYLIVHAIDGLPPGAYFYRRNERALELLKEGDFRREAGYLGLGQEIPRDASANIYFLADLDGILKSLGNRGYRAAQLEAAIMGGRLYLAAYAQRLGASGLTFFDDDVTEFFSPHAAGKSVMFLIAVGQSAKKKA